MRPAADRLFASALATGMIGLVALVGLAWLVRLYTPPLTPWYPLKAAGLFSIVMLVALWHVREYHPYSCFGRANQVTTGRTVLVGLVAGLIGEPVLPRLAAIATAFGVSATVLDGVDGWLARRVGTASRFGARYDVEVDTLLMLALAIMAWRHAKAGPWVLLTGLLRYLFVWAGWIWGWMGAPLSPTLRGRVICVVQIGALILAIVPAITPPASTVIAAVGLATLAYSFLVDTRRLWNAARLPGLGEAR